MHETNPLVREYLRQLEAGLSGLPAAERAELVREIESHLAEAESAGRPLAEVLEKLGPADRLARAYRIDAALSAPATGVRRVTRWFAAIGFLATTSLPSIIVIPALAGISIGCTLGGVVGILAGVVGLFVPAILTFLSPYPYGVPQLFGMGLGLVSGAIGLLAGWGLARYIRFLVGTVRSVLAR